MPHHLVTKPSRAFRRHPWIAVGLTALVLVWPGSGLGATKSPFRPFLGDWRGAGAVVAADGHKEQVTCRATYSSAQNTMSLTQSLVCASDSYRFDVEGLFVADGGNLQGHWAETTRNISGGLMGSVGNGDFEGTVTGPNFTALIAVSSNGSKQAVTIRPSAGDISSMEVVLQRRR